MEKRKTLIIQKIIYETIKEFPDISISELQIKIGTNPVSLREHLEQLKNFELIKEKIKSRKRSYSCY